MSGRGDRIVVVCGFPRSGTSLLMQMLAAAGLRCAGEFPAFEPEAVRTSPAPAFVKSMRGGAFKLLDPHRNRLPAGHAYDFIWTTRNRTQQAKSQLKLLRIVAGFAVDESAETVEKLAESMRRDTPAALAALRSHAGATLREVRFEDLIDRPGFTTAALATSLGIAGAEKMRTCVRPRAIRCLPGLLELEQIKEARP